MGDQPAGVKERRLFFRIQDKIYLSYRRADEPELNEAEGLRPIEHGRRGRNDPLRDLPSKLSALGNESRPVFRKLRKNSPDIAAAIDILDNKIGLIAAALMAQCMNDSGPTLCDVSLSVSGVGFAVAKPMPRGLPIVITMLLPPSLYKIVAEGRVIPHPNHNAVDADMYWIGIEFNKMDERDQEFLSKYILKKQADEIKRQRELEANRYI